MMMMLIMKVEERKDKSKHLIIIRQWTAAALNRYTRHTALIGAWLVDGWSTEENNRFVVASQVGR